MRPPLRHRFGIICCGLALLLLAAPLSAADPDDQNGPAVSTGKERLVSKADDQQRVDDCKVPVERRNASHPRPDDCGHPSKADTARPAPGLSPDKP